MAATDVASEIVLDRDFLADFVPALQQRLEQAEAHESYLRDLIKRQSDVVTRLRRALGAVDPSYVHPSTPKTQQKKDNPNLRRVGISRSNGTATGCGISMEKAKEFADFILAKIPEGQEKDIRISQGEIYKEMRRDQGEASNAFRWFRTIGFLRRAGRDKTTRRDLWAVMDRDAVDQAIATAEAAREAVEAAEVA